MRTHDLGQMFGGILCLRGGVHQQGAKAFQAHFCSRSQSISCRLCTTWAAIASNIAFAICEHHHNGRFAFFSQLIGQQHRCVNGMRQRRATPTGQTGQASFGTRQRARWRQNQFGRLPSECQHGHTVAPHIAVGQQQLHSAFGFGQTVESRRTRCVHHKHGGGLTRLAKTRDMEVFFAHHNALFLVCRNGLLPLPYFLPRRSGPQCFKHIDALACARLAFACTDGPAAQGVFLQGTRTARGGCFGALQLANFQTGQEPRWNGGLSCFEHQLGQIVGQARRFVEVVFGVFFCVVLILIFSFWPVRCRLRFWRWILRVFSGFRSVFSLIFLGRWRWQSSGARSQNQSSCNANMFFLHAWTAR